MSIDQIVNVTVTRETRAPSQRGFGTPLIVAYHTAWTDRVREYADEDELLDDGFTTSSYVYKMAQAIKAQDPSPTTFKVGRRSAVFTQIVHLLPRVLTVGFVYSIAVNGIAYTYTVEADDETDDVVDGLVAAMTAVPGVTVTDGTTHAICTSVAGAINTYEAGPGLDMLDATASPAGLADDLAAVEDEDADWYGALLDSNSAAQIAVFRSYIETRIALSVVQSADWNVKDAGETGDVATAMVNASIVRTGGIYHRVIGSPIAAAWMAKELPKNPGQSTWAFKPLALIQTDKLSTSEKSAIEGKRWSHYTRTGGQNITFEGKTPAGEYLDLIHQIDFSTARVKEAVFGSLTGNDKIPQTDRGIEMVKASVRAALLQCSTDPIEGGGDFPIFDRSTIVVTAPALAETTQQDRGNRILRGVEYRARLTGAFHRVVVRGTVYV